MFNNYLRTAFRNILRNKTYSFINILGFAVGLACFFLIALFIQDELSYENFHTKANRVFRAAPDWSARTAPKLAPSMQEYFPEIEKAVSLKRFFGNVEVGNQQFYEDQVFFANENIFELFSFNIVEGEGYASLEKPNTVVISEDMAHKYFGDAHPVGKTLMVMDTVQWVVGGVMKNIPTNTHFKPGILCSFKTYEQMFQPNLNTWQNNVYYTYFLLKEDIAVEQIIAKIPDFVSSQILAQTGRDAYALSVQNIRDIHLHSNLRMELEANSDASYLYIFGTIAFIVLLIACVNFMNLTTARATKRAKEIGIRKTVGAGKRQLIFQFLGESVMVAMLAMSIAFMLTYMALPILNQLSEKAISVSTAFSLNHIWIACMISLLVGLFSGIYPAMILSNYRPVEILKGKINHGRGDLSLRSALVVLQFTLALMLIVGTAMIYRQLNFMKDQPLGFEKEQVLVLKYYWDEKVQSNYESLKTRLLTIPGVNAVTRSGDIPGRMATVMSYRTEGMAEDDWEGINALYVDRDFIEVFGMEMVAGRAFNNEMPTDLTQGYILNESAVKSLGWTVEEAIGKPFRVHNEGHVIGVVRDFHYNSLQQRIEPLFIANRPSWSGYISLNVNTAQSHQVLEEIYNSWQALLADRPLDHQFLDEDFNRHYLAEQKLSNIVGIFTGLALGIAAIGLFGLATFVCESRQKEIAIRKVLGAKMSRILSILLSSFLKPLVFACVFGIPMAYWLSAQWMTQFPYQAAIDFMLFPLAILCILITAALAVGVQSVKAALADPVVALKDE